MSSEKQMNRRQHWSRELCRDTIPISGLGSVTNAAVVSYDQMKCWDRHEPGQRNHLGAALDIHCGRREKSAGTDPAEKLSL